MKRVGFMYGPRHMRKHVIDYSKENYEELEKVLEQELRNRRLSLQNYIELMEWTTTCGYEITLLIVAHMFKLPITVIRSDLIWVSEDIPLKECKVFLVQNTSGEFIGTRSSDNIPPVFVGTVPKISVNKKRSEVNMETSTPVRVSNDDNADLGNFMSQSLSPIIPSTDSNMFSNNDTSESTQALRNEVQKFEEKTLNSSEDVTDLTTSPIFKTPEKKAPKTLRIQDLGNTSTESENNGYGELKNELFLTPSSDNVNDSSKSTVALNDTTNTEASIELVKLNQSTHAACGDAMVGGDHNYSLTETDRGIDYSLKGKGNNSDGDNSAVTIGAENEDTDKTVPNSSNLSDSQRTLTDVKSPEDPDQTIDCSATLSDSQKTQTNVKTPEDPDQTLVADSNSSDNERTLTDAQNEKENDGPKEEKSEISDEEDVTPANDETVDNEVNRENTSEIIGEIHISTAKNEEAEKKELKQSTEPETTNEEQFSMSRISRRLRSSQKDEKKQDQKKIDVNGGKSEIIDDVSKRVPKVSETSDNKMYNGGKKSKHDDGNSVSREEKSEIDGDKQTACEEKRHNAEDKMNDKSEICDDNKIPSDKASEIIDEANRMEVMRMESL